MPNLPTALKTNYKTRKKERKYKTNHPTWLKLRAAQLRREPLCVDCNKQGKVTPANTVDHIDGNSWNNLQSNLQSMCTSCHTIKTNREDGGLGYGPTPHFRGKGG